MAQARKLREEARSQLLAGIDPSAVRQAEKQKYEAKGETFESVAQEWLKEHSPNWTPGYAARTGRYLELDIYPRLGKRPITDIRPRELLLALRKIQDRGALDTAHRVKQICGRVLRYAVATGRADRDCTADLAGALPPRKRKNFASITDPVKVGALLRAITGYQGTETTRLALKLAPLVFVRPGELRRAEWSEINLDANEWRIPAKRMKMDTEHIVPLSRQAKSILIDLHQLTGRGKYVFPGIRSRARPMSENTINGALRNLGYDGKEMTGHGFRSMASTLLNEMGWNGDAIERQLAHSERDSIRAAYNYAEHLPLRREMMQAWADYLDSLREERPVYLIHKGKAK